MNPVSTELLVLIGVGGCACFNAYNTMCIDIATYALCYTPAISASAADDTKCISTWIAPFNVGFFVFVGIYAIIYLTITVIRWFAVL